MADTLHGDSVEFIAYRLFEEIARVENKNTRLAAGEETPDRQWILETYVKCLDIARGGLF